MITFCSVNYLDGKARVVKSETDANDIEFENAVVLSSFDTTPEDILESMVIHMGADKKKFRIERNILYHANLSHTAKIKVTAIPMVVFDHLETMTKYKKILD